MNAYEILGVDPGADEATIKAAYRRAAMRAHPDRQGGSKDAFAAVQKAHDVLMDPERRARHDRGEGDMPAQTDPDMTMLATIFLQVIAASDTESADFTDIMRRSILDTREKYRQGITDAERNIAKLERACARVRRVDGGDNLLTLIAEGQIANMRNQIAGNEKSIAQGDRLLAILDQYETEPGSAAPAQFQNPFVRFAGTGTSSI